jgi:hypothetical protein
MYVINLSTALYGSALKVPEARLAIIAFSDKAWCPKAERPYIAAVSRL